MWVRYGFSIFAGVVDVGSVNAHSFSVSYMVESMHCHVVAFSVGVFELAVAVGFVSFSLSSCSSSV